MNKKLKKFLKVFIISTISIVALYGIIFYFNFFQGAIILKDNKISSSLLPTNDFTSNYKSKLNFADMNITAIDDVKINILDKHFSNELPILLKAQRYYIPLDIVCKTLNVSLIDTQGTLQIEGANESIVLNEKEYIKSAVTTSLRGNLIKKDSTYFISISDIEQVFGLTSIFNFKSKEISLLNSESHVLEKSPISTDGNIALIRLEDFESGDAFSSDENQTKMKAVGDFLFAQGIKYHIAWISKFTAPSENIDNNLLTNNDLQNVGFVNLLDYLINRNAMIGLHGYTHQAGDSKSALGVELSSELNNSEEDTRHVIESAIDTATALNIPFSFFESPHYRATNKQLDIAEEYFQFIYEPMHPLLYHTLQKTKNNNLYIPTPLGYVSDSNYQPIVKYLEKPLPNRIASLFYHPTMELDFIKFDTANSNLTFTYSEDSPLQHIVKTIKENDYATVHVTELINK